MILHIPSFFPDIKWLLALKYTYMVNCYKKKQREAKQSEMRWTQNEREGQRMHSSDSQCPLLLASCMMHVFPTIDHQNTCAKHLIKDRSPSFFLHFCTCTMIYILIYSHNEKNKKADVQTYKHQHIKHQISKTCRQGLKAPPLKKEIASTDAFITCSSYK